MELYAYIYLWDFGYKQSFIPFRKGIFFLARINNNKMRIQNHLYVYSYSVICISSLDNFNSKI